jgi:hypothetical protein
MKEDHMKPFQFLIGMLLMIATSMAAGHAVRARPEQAASPAAGMPASSSGGTFPKDIYPETGNRLPAIKRDALDDAGKKLYDERGAVESFGPGAIRL